MNPLLLLIDPNTFQSQALAWLGVATVVLGALSGFVALFISTLNKWKAAAAVESAKTKAEVAAITAAKTDARMDRQDSRVNALTHTMTQVALAATPPIENGTPTVDKVEVVNKEAIKVDDVHNDK